MIKKAEGYRTSGGTLYSSYEVALKEERKAALYRHLVKRDMYCINPSAYSAIQNFVDNYDAIMKELNEIN